MLQRFRTKKRLSPFAALLPVLFVLILGNTASGSRAQSVDELYGELDDFGAFGIPSLDGSADYLQIDAVYVEPYLILDAKIKSGWHFYAFSQKPGGSVPARLELDNATVTGPIRPTRTPTVAKNEWFPVPDEYFDLTVTWLVPVALKDGASPPITGRITGQVCAQSCVQQDVSFTAGAADADGTGKTIDLDVLLDAAEAVPEEFWYDPNAQPETENEAVTKIPDPAGADGPFLISEQERGDFLDRIDPQEYEEVTSLGFALFYALLGGLVLNVMPCVLPVIGLKILSFFEQAGHSRSRAFLLNASYSLGLLSVFLVLAAMSVALSWAFTYSLFGIIMALVVFAMALSLMDVWELSAPAFLGRGKSAKLMQQEGFFGAFFKGIGTTLLAIPCGAPLLSPAVVWADTQIRSGQVAQVYLVYGVIGLGMALPYLLIGAFPELLRFLPKPGAWMDTFKKIMGFCLLIAVVWILYFIDMSKVVPTVAVLFALWFACWIVGRFRYERVEPVVRIQSWLWAILVLAVTVLLSFNIKGLPVPYTLEKAMQRRLDDWAGLRSEGHWIPYTHNRLAENLLVHRRPVVIDFTADWCVNCKVLEATVLESRAVLDELDRRGIVSLKADCTRRDSEATWLLRRLGPESVPTIAIFSPERPHNPVLLRGNFTAKTLIERLP